MASTPEGRNLLEALRLAEQQMLDDARATGNPVKVIEVQANIDASRTLGYQRWVADTEERLRPLLDKRDIPHDSPEAWLMLALALAQEQNALGDRKVGPRIKWDDHAYALLYWRVEFNKRRIAKAEGCTPDDAPASRACEMIVQEHPDLYVTAKGGRVSAHSLHNRYINTPPAAILLLQQWSNDAAKRNAS